MKNKLIWAFLVMIMCIMLTGCGKENNVLNGIDPNGNYEQNIDKNTEKNNEGQDDNTKNEYDLYSDDTKIVFDYSGIYKMVYYHDGINITGMEYIYNFQDASTASYVVTNLESEYADDTGVDSVVRKGQYVIVKFNKSQIEGLTLEEIKETYSYLEQVKSSD